MIEGLQFLPGTGRWQREALTEGAHFSSSSALAASGAPSTSLRLVPLPLRGRICHAGTLPNFASRAARIFSKSSPA